MVFGGHQFAFRTQHAGRLDTADDADLKIDPDDCVQRDPNYAIVDEEDSILIDEARTPLIISGQVEKSSHKLIKKLVYKR